MECSSIVCILYGKVTIALDGIYCSATRINETIRIVEYNESLYLENSFPFLLGNYENSKIINDPT